MSSNRMERLGAAPKSRPLLGVAGMLAAMVMLPAMDAIAKWLASSLPVLEIVWARYFIYALVALLFALRQHGRSIFRPAAPILQLIRGSLMAVSAWSFFSAVGRMALADAMAVFFIYPFLVLLISSRLSGESAGIRLWAISAIGFAGALISIHPTLGGFPPGVPFALCAGVAYALSLVLTRRLGKHDAPLVTTAWSAMIGLAGFSLSLPFIWTRATSLQWGAMVIMGAIAATGHFLIVAAHTMTTASRLAPLGYIEIAAALAIGNLAFGSVPSTTVWLGLVLIAGSGLAAARHK